MVFEDKNAHLLEIYIFVFENEMITQTKNNTVLPINSLIVKVFCRIMISGEEILSPHIWHSSKGDTDMKSKIFEIGRFAYLLPYIIMPFIVMTAYKETILSGFVYSYFMPFGIESPAIILYPVSWIASLVCFILCAIVSRKTNKGKGANIICAAVTGIWIVIHIIMMIGFISSFTISF